MIDKSNLVYADMTLIKNRLDLINRYKHCFGIPDAAQAELQSRFIRGEMGPSETLSFVRFTEYILSQMLRDKYRL